MARRKCSTTGKDRFPNKLECDLAIVDIHRSNSHNRHRKYRDEPTRSYRCEFCGGWHMTSQVPDKESPDLRPLTR
jgi:hypothetical protein